jgi:hypothetical protein
VQMRGRAGQPRNRAGMPRSHTVEASCQGDKGGTVDKSERRRQVLDALRQHSVSACEYAVLGIVHYRINAPPRGVAEDAHLYSDDAGHPLENYLRAVDSCVEKGWLTILTQEDLEREERRRLSSTVPEVIDTSYCPGDVDFTEAGAALYQTLLRELWGPEHLLARSGWNWDEEDGRFDIYAGREEDCRSWLREMTGEGCIDGAGRPARVVRVEGPLPIGPWRPYRFLTLPSGFHAVLKVETVEGRGGR